MSQAKKYSWAVIGGGPGGITAVGMLLDAGVSETDILWVDPTFTVGDFGRYWGEVNSNTKVALFLNFLRGIDSFDYHKKTNKFAIDSLDENGFTPLSAVAEPLQWVTDHLTQRVNAIQSWVETLSIEQGCWKLSTNSDNYYADKVIMATGSEPKSLNYPSVKAIDLVTALTPSRLANQCLASDTVAVFGSSHSAMIIVRNLVEQGVKKIVNFYQSPLKFAVLLDDWILYDDTGLKGETAAWVRENVSSGRLSQLERFVANKDNIEHHLPGCNKVVYAVGFQQRQMNISGVSLSQYDSSNGIIAPGLFGVGIGFPIKVTDPFGRHENNVGLWKFLKNLRKTLPIWQQYGL